MAKISDDTKISKNKTVGDWKELRKNLLQNEYDSSLVEEYWKEAFDEFFKARVETRYLKPIEAIQSSGNQEGEGFSIVALQCLLIEFLEVFYQGKIYTTKKEDLGPKEYCSSREIFKDFLTSHSPFNKYFVESFAAKFYDNVRCGLLHSTFTKLNWVIRAGNENTPLVEEKDENGSKIFVIYRNPITNALKRYLEDYENELLTEKNKERRENFIRKMDDICQIEHMHYFAYGSNINKKHFKKEKKINFHSYEVGFLKEYEFVFNKKSDKDGTSKANICSKPGCEVWGCCYEIEKDDWKKLLDAEKKYKPLKNVDIEVNSGRKIKADTLISNYTLDTLPSQEYLQIIIKGAKEMKLPKKYISEIQKKGQ